MGSTISVTRCLRQLGTLSSLSLLSHLLQCLKCHQGKFFGVPLVNEAEVVVLVQAALTGAIGTPFLSRSSAIPHCPWKAWYWGENKWHVVSLEVR